MPTQSFAWQQLPCAPAFCSPTEKSRKGIRSLGPSIPKERTTSMMDDDDSEVSNTAYGFDILKGLQNASQIVAELSPPKSDGNPIREQGPYGLPLAPFCALTPRPPKKETKLGESCKQRDAAGHKKESSAPVAVVTTVATTAEKKPKREDTVKHGSSERLLRRTFSVNFDMTNDQTTEEPSGELEPVASVHCVSTKRRTSTRRHKSKKETTRRDSKERKKKSKTKPKPLGELIDAGRPEQRPASSVVSDPILTKESKASKESRSRRKLLRKTASADCVTEFLSDDEVGVPLFDCKKHQSRDKGKKLENLVDNSDQRKKRPKVRKTRSSKEMSVSGCNKEERSKSSSNIRVPEKKASKSSKDEPKRRGVTRSVSTDCVTDLLSCFTSDKARESLALLDVEPKRKERSATKKNSRPHLDRCVSTSVLAQQSESVSVASRKATRLKKKAKAKKRSSDKVSHIIVSDENKRKVAEGAKQMNKGAPVEKKALERSLSSPDMNVPTAPAPLSENIVPDQMTRMDFKAVDLPRDTLKKSFSVPDNIQQSSQADERIGNLCEPRRMSLDEACKLLLSNDQSLSSLDLSGASIGDEGVCSLSKAMTNNWYLREIHLGRSGITQVGAKHLALCLRRNKTLERLYLQENSLGDEGVETLSSSFAENHTLVVLNVARNGVGDIGAAALAEEISPSCSLQKLYLYENRIADIGAAALGEIVMANPKLYELFLWDNAFSEKGAADLRLAIKHRKDKHPSAMLHVRSSWKHEGVVAQV